MKQLLQNMRSGETSVVDVPTPEVRRGTALVRTTVSLVSAGTERMLVEFAEKNLVGKAQARPDLVRQVLDKARREGLLTTAEAALNKLDQPMVLGYSSTGTIVAIGDGLTGFKIGDRVACAGGGHAVHAEYAVVPQNLLTPLPPQVDFESAAFTTLGAIALQGFRLAEPQLGDRVAVIGLGLLGLLSVLIAKAAGCSVLGVDLNPQRVELARQLGAEAVSREQAVEAALAFSHGNGCDSVLICADATSSDPVELAGVIARDRAHVVAVGAVGLEIPRKVYYEKELTFLVSRSYGPGRYDLDYEENGQDYPIGYVRWTEGRNMEAFVELMARGEIDVKPLISHHFPIEQAAEAYTLITGKEKQPFLGVLLTYPTAPLETTPARRIFVSSKPLPGAVNAPFKLGVLGAGNYAMAMFLPTVKAVGRVQPVAVASANGVSARHAAQKYGFGFATSDEAQVMDEEYINIVAVLTRHNQHARQVQAALQRGKHVFCEKPLAINEEELRAIAELLEQENTPKLMVGFNRRFAPLAVRMKKFIDQRSEPLIAQYRINAGPLPLNHWLHDPEQGGGRIIGEACHFVDFLTYLVGEPPQAVSAISLPDGGRYQEDNVVLTFSFADGSLGTVTYLANGDKAFPKERVEVFSSGRAAALDDFRSLELSVNGRRSIIRSRLRQDKGHRAAWSAFLDSLRSGGLAPISYVDLIGVTQATFKAVEALRKGEKLTIPA